MERGEWEVGGGRKGSALGRFEGILTVKPWLDAEGGVGGGPIPLIEETGLVKTRFLPATGWGGS